MKITFTKKTVIEAIKNGCRTVGDLNQFIYDTKEIK